MSRRIGHLTRSPRPAFHEIGFVLPKCIRWRLVATARTTVLTILFVEIELPSAFLGEMRIGRSLRNISTVQQLKN
jgi:hypothetical protein